MRKIGLITWHYYSNYGSMLQTYALIKTVRKLGHDIRVMNYHNPKFGKVSRHRERLKKIINYIPYEILKRGSKALYFPRDRFRKYFNETPIVYSGDDLKKQSEAFDTFLCGSDQIWAPNVFNPIYFLDFVPDTKTKVSYAASIGLNEVPASLRCDYERLIKRIDHLSVRESRGQEIIKSVTGRDAIVVVDPTLLVSEDAWLKIALFPNQSEPYIFCYFLKEDHAYSDAIKMFAKERSLKVIGISMRKRDSEIMQLLNECKVGPREFLGLIKRASIVITDSYHGTIFSILFHRPFITLERFDNNDVLCQNSRIKQLMEYFPIESNIVKIESDTKLNLSDVNWSDVDSNLDILRTKSINFLNSSLTKC